MRKQSKPKSWGELEEAFIARNRSQMTVGQLAAKLGRTRDSVACKLRQNGVKKWQLRPMTEAVRKEITDLHVSGLSAADIADRVSVGRYRVRRILRSMGYCLACKERLGAEQFQREMQAKATRARDKKAQSMGYQNWASYILTRKRVKIMSQAPGCVGTAEVCVYQILRDTPLPLNVVTGLASKRCCSRRGAYRAVKSLLEHGFLKQHDGVIYVPQRRDSHTRISRTESGANKKDFPKTFKISIDD